MIDDFSGGRQKRVRVDSYGISPFLKNSNNQSGAEALAIASDDPDWRGAFSEMPVEQEPGGINDGPDNNSGSNQQPPKDSNTGGDKPWYKRIAVLLASLSRKQWLIIMAVFILVVAGCISAFLLTRPAKVTQGTKITNSKPAPVPPPPPVSPLSGQETAEENTKRPVIGVMIENSIFARPQSGLEQAGVVYEAIAEYGITRFLALFQETNPGNVGPIRSARPYYVEWANAYEAAYAHVGGSPDALAKIKGDGVRDMDQFANSGSYHRTSSRDAPHNVYTGIDTLRSLAAAKGWSGSNFTSLIRKKEEKGKEPTANRIDIAISGPTYGVHYDYDPPTNTYLRKMAGEDHKDADTSIRIAPKVVIGLATQYSLLSDGYHSSYATTGSGSVKIFQDGSVTEGTWKRDGPKAQYQFFDSAGKPVALNPGQTWFTIVGDQAAITYAK